MFLPAAHMTASISNVADSSLSAPHACDKRVPIPCKTKDSSSGVCNGCNKKSSCKLTKKFYAAQAAQDEYEYTLKNSRMEWNISSLEARNLAETLKPLLEKGQSIAHILMTHGPMSRKWTS